MNTESQVPRRQDIKAFLDTSDKVTFDTLSEAFPSLDDETVKKILSDLDSY